MTALHDLTAAELLDRYRDRSLSPVEVTRAVLERIAAWEPHLHATYALDADAALARRAARRRAGSATARRRDVGALDGVPVTIKENIATARHAGAARHRGDRARAGAGATRRRRRACAKRAR